MTKHTPGPWRVRRKDRLAVVTDIPEWGAYAASEMLIAETVHKADARLIAAAPDLLEALKFAMRYGRLDYHQRTNHNAAYCDGVDHARAAIAAAEG
jgi:hypothetical protein